MSVVTSINDLFPWTIRNALIKEGASKKALDKLGFSVIDKGDVITAVHADGLTFSHSDQGTSIYYRGLIITEDFLRSESDRKAHVAFLYYVRSLEQQKKYNGYFSQNLPTSMRVAVTEKKLVDIARSETVRGLRKTYARGELSTFNTTWGNSSLVISPLLQSSVQWRTFCFAIDRGGFGVAKEDPRSGKWKMERRFFTNGDVKAYLHHGGDIDTIREGIKLMASFR